MIFGSCKQFSHKIGSFVQQRLENNPTVLFKNKAFLWHRFTTIHYFEWPIISVSASSLKNVTAFFYSDVYSHQRLLGPVWHLHLFSIISLKLERAMPRWQCSLIFTSTVLAQLATLTVGMYMVQVWNGDWWIFGDGWMVANGNGWIVWDGYGWIVRDEYARH